MAAKNTHGLGRGLSALLGGEDVNLDNIRKPVGYVNKVVASPETPSPKAAADIMRIPVSLVEPNPYQPRMTFDVEALEELSESIRTLGLIQPITVRKSGDKYQIISGERRFRACRLAGMDMVPAYILSTDDQGMLEMAIVENIQRQDLDPIEVAMSYQRLIEECHLTQEQMASRVGKKRASITNSLRLLKLPAKVQHDLKVGLLSVGHAKVILSVDDPSAQQQLCDAVVKDGLSVRELEELVRRLNNGSDKPGRRSENSLSESGRKIVGIFSKYAGKASMHSAPNGKSSLTLKFDSEQQLGDFLAAIQDKL